jgi:uncharacterized membrane protein (DUF106 family)
MDDAAWVKFLLGAIITLICSWLSYIAGARGKMTEASCAKCQDTCKREMLGMINALKEKQAELKDRQSELDDEISKKLDLVFRMLRAVISHLPIAAEKRVEILNEKGN